MADLQSMQIGLITNSLFLGAFALADDLRAHSTSFFNAKIQVSLTKAPTVPDLFTLSLVPGGFTTSVLLVPDVGQTAIITANSKFIFSQSRMCYAKQIRVYYKYTTKITILKTKAYNWYIHSSAAILESLNFTKC